MPPVWNDGAGENAPLCCGEISLRHHGGHIHRSKNPTCPLHNRKHKAIFIYRCNRLSGMNGLAHMDGPKWFGTAWTTFRLTLRADTSLSLCVIWNEGRAQCSPCIHHAALVTIINLTRHLPQLHNHLHLQSLPAMLTFFFLYFPPPAHTSTSTPPPPPSLHALCHLVISADFPLPQSLNIVFLISTVALINGIVQREWRADGFITQTNTIASKTVAHSAMIPP